MKHILTFVFFLLGIISFSQNSQIEELWNLYNSRDFHNVIEKATPLLEHEPGNIDLNLMIGRSYTDLAAFEDAIPYLEFTVKNDLGNSWRKAWALSYLGPCYFVMEDYTGSEKSINDCIRLNATKNATNAANGMAILFGFNQIYKEWKIAETDHFRFHFQKMSDDDMENFASSREDAFEKINQFFNSDLPKKIDFFVWNSREDAQKLMHANLGFSKPELCVVHSHYQQTRGHEMTHVISNYTTQMINKTGLINEGTAVCFDLTNQNKEQIVKDWLKTNGEKVIIEEIWANWNAYPEELTYPLSGLFVKALINNFGQEKFLEFFRNQTYDNGKLVFGDNLDLIIQDFENNINL